MRRRSSGMDLWTFVRDDEEEKNFRRQLKSRLAAETKKEGREINSIFHISHFEKRKNSRKKLQMGLDLII